MYTHLRISLLLEILGRLISWAKETVFGEIGIGGESASHLIQGDPVLEFVVGAWSSEPVTTWPEGTAKQER